MCFQYWHSISAPEANATAVQTFVRKCSRLMFSLFLRRSAHRFWRALQVLIIAYGHWGESRSTKNSECSYNVLVLLLPRMCTCIKRKMYVYQELSECLPISELTASVEQRLLRKIIHPYWVNKFYVFHKTAEFSITCTKICRWSIYWAYFNPLNTARRLLYLKTQFVPCSKHFSSLL